MMPMHEPNHLKPVLPLNFPTYDSKKNRTMTHITSFFLLTNSHEQYKSQFEFKMRAVAWCVFYIFLVFPWIFRLKQTKSDENWTSTTDNLMFVRAPVAHTVFLWWNCFLYICFFFFLWENSLFITQWNYLFTCSFSKESNLRHKLFHMWSILMQIPKWFSFQT